MEDRSSGRGHYKKRKKGARLNFDKRKNDERRCQENKSKLQADPLVTRREPLMPRTLPDNSQPSNRGFEVLKHDVASFPLPEQWQVFSDLNSVEYCCFGRDEDGTRQVAKSISVKSDLTWVVKVQGHLVPATCNALASHPPRVLSSSIAQALLKGVDQATLCPGNPDPDFLALCHERGGVMKGERGHGGVVAFIDTQPVIDARGRSHSSTIRRVDCDLLCEQPNKHPTRCHACHSFRSTLRSSVSRRHSSDDSTSPSSHTNFQYLSSFEKDERLRRLHQEVRQSRQTVQRLETRMRQLIERMV